MSKKSEGQTKKGKYYKSRQCIEINNAVNRSGLTVTQFAKQHNLPRTSLQLWCTGYQRPSEKYDEKLAKICGCDINYFRGIVDYRTTDEAKDEIVRLQSKIDKANTDLTIMNEKKSKLKYTTLLKSNAKKGLNQLALNLDSSINEFDNDVKILDATYADIVSTIISDVELWRTLIENAEKLITTKTDLAHLTKFENTNNRNIDIDLQYTTGITPEEQTSLIISKSLLKVFFNYIKKKENELNLKELDLPSEEHKIISEIHKRKSKKKNTTNK